MLKKLCVLGLLMAFISILVVPGRIVSKDVYPLIGDKDWNFWANFPHMFAMPPGNVGIGTTDPVKKLHVMGDAMLEKDSDIDLGVMSQHGEVSLSLISWHGKDTSVNFVTPSTVESSWSIYREGITRNLIIEESQTFPIMTPRKWMFEHGTGSLSCNTDYPLTMLDIRTPDGGYDNLAIRLDPNNGSWYGGTAWEIENNSADFRITEDKGMPGYPETRLIIQEATGNVGLGVNNPQQRLHVNGAINLDPVPEPATPSAGFVIYVDHLDGKLKAKSDFGSITELAEP